MSSARTRLALVTGGAGQLGCELAQAVPVGWRVVPCSSSEMDVTRAELVTEVLERTRPVLVINAAAYTAVDSAEGDPDRAHAVNATGAANVAAACRRVGARLVQVSTDYVFDGTGDRPYRPEDAPRPLGVYGRTKLAGEREVLHLSGGEAVILRSAWLYSRHGRNFVRTMLGRFRAGEQVDVVCDQVGTPTWCRSLAEAIWATAERPEVRGIHHWTDEGTASWYDFAVAIQEEALSLGLIERRVAIRPLTTEQYPTPARRPTYSVLDSTETAAALQLSRRPWPAALHLMLEGLARG